MKKHSFKETEKDKEKKKEKEKKDKDKREKRKEKALTQEELQRLEEAKKGLFHRLSDPSKPGGQHSNGAALAHSGSSEGSREGTPEPPAGETAVYKTKMEVKLRKGDHHQKVPPRTRPKPKKGILKEKSHYGGEIPNQGVRGNLDDTQTLEENTVANEVLAAELAEQKILAQQREREAHSVKNIISSFEQDDDDHHRGTGTGPTANKQYHHPAKRPSHPPPALPESEPPNYRAPDPPKGDGQVTNLDQQLYMESEDTPPSPAEKTYSDIDLHLPNVAPPRCLSPRDITLKRQPAGDFGFSLRRGTVLQRGLEDNVETKRTVIFAEPGPKNSNTGLLPGDRLLEVNGSNVENASREDIILLIRNSEAEVRLKVQPIPELSELSVRSGLEGEDIVITEQNVKMGTLKRSGSMRFKARQVCRAY